MKYLLETIAFEIESCKIAQSAGAGRIELCANPLDGGTTPTNGFIKAARKILQIPLNSMIRHRGGDFVCSNDEFAIMKDDIIEAKKLGCDGVVLGLLTPDGKIDKLRTAQLVELAYPMSVTFHRAFDRCASPMEALEDIINCGCERILTSGQQPTAIEAVNFIADLVKQADERIIIMPGTGINSGNIKELKEKTGAKEFHASAKLIKNSTMQFINSQMNESLQTYSVDGNEVQKLVKLLASDTD